VIEQCEETFHSVDSYLTEKKKQFAEWRNRRLAVLASRPLCDLTKAERAELATLAQRV
jgi:hypothetical protein